MNRSPQRLLTLVTSTLLLTGLCASTFAQGPAAPRSTPQRRAANNTARPVPQLNPELERVLKSWEIASGKITELQGDHERIVYDDVFQTMKYAYGKFYFQAPDKGRLDLRPKAISKSEEMQVIPRLVFEFDKKNGVRVPVIEKRADGRSQQRVQDVQFKAMADTPEKWVSTGKEILSIKDAAKTFERIPIPPEAQGERIIDGPLPFLFGLQAEKAKVRYQLQLGPLHGRPSQKRGSNYVHVIARPNFQHDASNWSRAEVLLDDQTYLPFAIKLIDPAFTKETVYKFSDLDTKIEVGLFKFFGDRDPFHPDLRGYQTITNKQAIQQTGAIAVPSVIGMGWQEGKSVLEKSGFVVKLAKGQPAARAELVGRVYQQSPPPRTPAQKGQQVSLTIADQAPTPATSGEKVSMPRVIGLSWQEAKKQLEDAGFVVKLKKGEAARRKEHEFRVYEQSVPEKATAFKGQDVTLTLFLEVAK